jgi:proteasome accessory factor A
MTMLVHEAAVEAAVTTPPEDTRAWFRGTCLDKWPTQIAAASWDSVIFDVPGRQALQRVPMLEPERGTKAHVGAILDRSPDVITLLRELDAAAG